MKVIGLTGPYSSGKNEVATAFAQLGCAVIDVDQIGHTVLAERSEMVIAHFGPEIANPDGSVNRGKLAQRVFGKAALADLEAIVHPAMRQKVFYLVEEYRQSGSPCVVINAAILQKMALDSLCDAICYVQTAWLKRLVRARRRDGVSLSGFLRRNKSQKALKSTLVKGSRDVYVLNNSGSRAFIHRQATALCVTMSIQCKETNG